MPARSLTGLTTCIRPICRILFANKTHDDDDDDDPVSSARRDWSPSSKGGMAMAARHLQPDNTRRGVPGPRSRALELRPGQVVTLRKHSF